MAVYSDIDITLSKQTDGDIKKDEDVQAIFNALENIVKTIQGSRRMMPDFVYGPHNFLFEPINEINAIRLGNTITNAITEYENRIEVTNVHVAYDTGNNEYRTKISFYILPRVDVIQTIDFILKRI